MLVLTHRVFYLQVFRTCGRSIYDCLFSHVCKDTLCARMLFGKVTACKKLQCARMLCPLSCARGSSKVVTPQCRACIADLAPVMEPWHWFMSVVSNVLWWWWWWWNLLLELSDSQPLMGTGHSPTWSTVLPLTLNHMIVFRYVKVIALDGSTYNVRMGYENHTLWRRPQPDAGTLLLPGQCKQHTGGVAVSHRAVDTIWLLYPDCSCGKGGCPSQCKHPHMTFCFHNILLFYAHQKREYVSGVFGHAHQEHTLRGSGVHA